uniref:Protein kinase domain-containing protein n=1 Tax=Rhodosorus marinus TaxID=101924 RepID=A0A7S2ZMT4_9RHOD|mmetsp:Transcript_24027/g.94661  ORF Transcript_24027/g.94661 Transcript_24027/m.94661 type:complete len:162 (+) Transcript_24027:606-1091(+)
MTGWLSRPCEPVEKYEKLSRVGEGTYGVVYRARDKKTGEIVALKRIRLRPESSRRERGKRKSSDAKKQRFDEEGFPVTSLREIVLLQKLSHRNVINLREVVVKRGSKVKPIFFWQQRVPSIGLSKNNHPPPPPPPPPRRTRFRRTAISSFSITVTTTLAVF